MASLFRPRRKKGGGAHHDGDGGGGGKQGKKGRGAAGAETAKRRGRRVQKRDHLNCGVPQSVRTQLSRSGVSMPMGKYEVQDAKMFAQLRTTGSLRCMA